MSDLARNYVKQLPRSQVTGAQKKFLFFVADYHNFKTGCAWPGIQTLADDMGITVRQVRNLLQQCNQRGLISWTAGLGNGNLGKFVFLDLEKCRREAAAKEEQKEDIKEETKGEVKGEILGGVIRKNLDPGTLILEPEDHHGCAALQVWLKIKEELKTELELEEWNQWVRPMYFVKELDHKFLLFAVPPSTQVVRGYRKRELLLRQKLSERGYTGCGLTKYPEAYELERLAAVSPDWAEVAARLSRKKAPSRVSRVTA